MDGGCPDLARIPREVRSGRRPREQDFTLSKLYKWLILLAPRTGFEPVTCPLGGGRAILCATGAHRNFARSVLRARRSQCDRRARRAEHFGFYRAACGEIVISRVRLNEPVGTPTDDTRLYFG